MRLAIWLYQSQNFKTFLVRLTPFRYAGWCAKRILCMFHHACCHWPAYVGYISLYIKHKYFLGILGIFQDSSFVPNSKLRKNIFHIRNMPPLTYVVLTISIFYAHWHFSWWIFGQDPPSKMSPVLHQFSYNYPNLHPQPHHKPGVQWWGVVWSVHSEPSPHLEHEIWNYTKKKRNLSIYVPMGLLPDT